MTNYTRKAVWGAATSMVFLALSTLTALLLRMVLARRLTLEDFGLFYAVLAFVGMFTFLRDFGLSEAQVRFIPRFIHRKLLGRIKGLVYLVLSVQAVVGSLFFLAFVLISPFLTQHYFKSSAASEVLLLLGAWFLLDGMIETLQYAFNATQRIAYQTSMEFLHLLGALGVTIVLLGKGFGPSAPAAGYFLAAAFVVAMYYILLRTRVFPSFSREKATLTKADVKEYLAFSLPLVPASAAIDFLFSKITVVLLTFLGSLSQVALFTASLSVSKLLRHVYTPLKHVVFPISSELWETGRTQRLSEGIIALYKYALIVTLPLAGLLVVFPEELLRILFGESYVAGRIVLQLLAPTMILLTYSTIIESVFMGVGKSTLTTKQIYVGGILNVLFGFALIPRWGMHGAALALLIAIAGRLAYGMVQLRQFVKAAAPWSLWARTAAASLCFFAAISLLKGWLHLIVPLEIVLSLSTASALYLAVLFLFGVLTLEEVKTLLIRLFRRDSL